MSEQQEPKELREALERSQAAETKAVSELREYKAGVLFKDAGLQPKHAELFLKTNPDAEVTAETAAAFADEYSLAPVQVPASDAPKAGEEAKPVEGAPVTPAAAPADAGLAAMGEAAGSAKGGTVPAVVAKMSNEAFQELLATNPAEAAKAYTEGRVERNSLNVQADQLVQKGIINH